MLGTTVIRGAPEVADVQPPALAEPLLHHVESATAIAHAMLILGRQQLQVHTCDHVLSHPASRSRRSS